MRSHYAEECLLLLLLLFQKAVGRHYQTMTQDGIKEIFLFTSWFKAILHWLFVQRGLCSPSTK